MKTKAYPLPPSEHSRRTFLKQAGLLSAACLVAPSVLASPLAPQKKIGIQLFTLREVIRRDIQSILQKVAKAGYQEVETYGYSRRGHFWGIPSKNFGTLLKENNLTAPSGHYDLENYLLGKKPDDLKVYIEAANEIGSTYVTVPYLQEQSRRTADDFKRIAAKLNEGGEWCKNAGLKIAYHNHDFEFTSFNGVTGMDILLNETDKSLVDFELDLYWVLRSNQDALAMFKNHPGRFTMWHVKDMDKVNQDLNTEVGKGKVPFRQLFAKAKLSGLKHFFVEQETNYQPDEIGSIQTSLHYLRKELLK